MRSFPNDRQNAEQCYTFEDALIFIEHIRNTELIILGGDVLTKSGEYTHINWYYTPTNKETATTDSCECATKFITGLANHEIYLYLFVVSSYEACMDTRALFDVKQY